MAQLEQIQQQALQAKQLFREEKYSEAEEKMIDVLKAATEYFKDELALGMAEFYYLYGAILVTKISETHDVFGQRVHQAENERLGDEETDKESEEEGKIQDEPQDENQIEELDDFNAAWENLEVARVILEKEIQNTQDLTYHKNLAQTYARISELEQWRDNFDSAQEHLLKALSLRQKIEDEGISRDIAEIYFMLGNVVMYNYKEGKEVQALEYYQKAVQILENNLSNQIKSDPKVIVLQEKYDRSHLKITFLDTDNIKDLKQVIGILYDKLEDVRDNLKMIQTEEYQKMKEDLVKQKEADEKQSEMQTFPVAQVQTQNVIQLGSFGNARKKQQEQQELEKQQKQEQQETGEEAVKKARID